MSKIDYYCSAYSLSAYLGSKKFLGTAKITNSVGLDTDNLIATSNSKYVLKTCNKNTEEAVALSMFSSPTCVIDGDMFHGWDSLNLV